MRKMFTFIFAALMSVSMFGRTVQQDIPITADNWGWSYGCQVSNVGDMLQCTLTSEWGALSTGWDPEIDLSEWDRIVIVVENMNGCDGEWFKLKGYLRDNTDSEANQMEGQLGLDAEDRVQNNLVIDLHQQKECDITHARVLAVQCQPNGAEFKISRVYLEKEEKGEYTVAWVNAPVDGKPASVDIVGSFSEEGTAVELLDNGWFIIKVEVTADDTFKLCDAANHNMDLCQKIDGQWIQDIIKFGDVWADDSYKGDPCKSFELDLSNAELYAWKENMPETAGISTIEATTANKGAWYDLNGRKQNGTPTQKGIYIKNGVKVVIK